MGLESNYIEIQGYHKLEIYQLSRSLAIQIHELTLSLPKFETYEECSQIRRSSKSITSNIVEGYALRKNKKEFLQYLNRAYGSCEETIQHLDFLFSTQSFKDEVVYKKMQTDYTHLSKMIFRFIQSVNNSHEIPYYIKEDIKEYLTDSNIQPIISNPLPLHNRTILITRSADSNSRFRALLESRGAMVICFPTIEIANPDSWSDCDAALWKLAEYESICFTSKNAVEKFVQRLRLVRPQALNIMGTRNIYAVGEKTKSALEVSGFSVQPIPQKHSAEELAHSFYGNSIKGKRFLFPKSNIARDLLPNELRTLGASVDEVTVYKTVIPEIENIEQVRSLLVNKAVEIVTFFSPSSFRNFVDMFDADLLQSVIIAVIGQTTAESVKDACLSAEIIAKVSTSEGLVEALEEYFSKIANPKSSIPKG